MRYLLDTHVLLWMRENNPRLKRSLWEPIFHSKAHEIYFSLVSLWEIAIKRSMGKLRLEGTLEDFSLSLEARHGFRLLPLEVPHLSRMEKLPREHGDPFDRMLIAQAIEIGATAVTNDPHWKKYQVKIRW
ncbi:MAG: type II toxin-antitoxin system VapC family toxin [Verrucomicrobia bacterium]|nr:type II toxin-antitoxin system VapC family toxin [Verrucomicrobiota bacterium]